ncbi:hypothetical protein SAMN04487996_107138 [Dyadobacter soli]|uniref:Uncharacterized protein n=1 Tax=Dyadobacter soli TaxID=659014 RepID=A0A1G7G620_9BACT|nr:hypothetical protein SAMN04487996_107138 [Dyadobacter soli]
MNDGLKAVKGQYTSFLLDIALQQHMNLYALDIRRVIFEENDVCTMQVNERPDWCLAFEGILYRCRV